MKHIALAASLVMLVLVTVASAAPQPARPAEEPAMPAFAGLEPLHGLPGSETDADDLEPPIEVASYFSFMRSFGRICYSYALGYYYC